MSQPTEVDLSMDVPIPVSLQRPPVHGFQGNRGTTTPLERVPTGITVTISREAGARGGTIARLVAAKLGWQVYDQELLEYMTQDAVVRQGLLDALPEACLVWLRQRLDELEPKYHVKSNLVLRHMAEVVLALGSQGQLVLIGHGGGILLPRPSTLSVRIVGPLEERIAYMQQWLRLSREEAVQRVRTRDERRTTFLKQTFGIHPNDPHLYDLVLNASWLGEEGAADLIAAAARRRSEPE